MLSYSGDILSHQAWEILEGNPNAYLIDVRTKEEVIFDGAPNLTTLNKQPIFIEWKQYPSMNINSNFANELVYYIKDKKAFLLFLCHSGIRSMEAAKAIAKLGYENCYNITDGFEGTNEIAQQENISGWKAFGLPWRQI